MTASPLLALGDRDFISLTTFRRSGEAVPTPVWVVPDGDRLAVFTPAGTGKLKRVRHTPRVTVAECSRRGSVPDDAVPVEARASATDDPAEVDRVTRMLARKYGLQFTVFMLVEKVVARGERAREVIHLHPAEAPDGSVTG
ncbi:PPOX class F420-dependent oxidoreductase [Oryzobacter terrae]|uniref:PPOX class F420-dependent oxidoreductase n=1 Tax=Oryzobacter terrae TaxID=1620385 RepID=UPI00366F349D